MKLLFQIPILLSTLASTTSAASLLRGTNEHRRLDERNNSKCKNLTYEKKTCDWLDDHRGGSLLRDNCESNFHGRPGYEVCPNSCPQGCTAWERKKEGGCLDDDTVLISRNFGKFA